MKHAKTAIVIIAAVIIFGGYYFFLSHRNAGSAEDNVEVTELDEVLSKSLDSAYPPTPREVVKFYNRIIECAYGSEYSDEQFNQLAEQARKMIDEELLEENPLESYKSQLQKEIASYKENSQKIIRTDVCAADEVEKRNIENRECAYVLATYFLKTGGSQFDRTYQRYLLRKDADGKWKILAFYLANGEEP